MIVLCSVFLLFACNSPEPKEVLKVTTIQGKTQGTTYTIKYIDTNHRDVTREVDSILHAIDLSVSTYNSNSILSHFNNGDSCTIINDHVLDLFLKSDEIYGTTKGAFDPTIKPIVNIWGFGSQQLETDTFYTDAASNEERESLLLNLRDSLSKIAMEYVGWDLVILDGDIFYNKLALSGTKEDEDNFICKEEKEIQLSFDAIAQGYSADVIGYFFQYKLGINSFLIEVGGEILAQGRKPDGKYWNVLIENPNLSAGEQEGVASVEMSQFRAVAVSGNYRSYREYLGKKYGHCLDPRTGKPSESTMVSAAVFADDCAIADAYATAFMVMGIEESVPFVEGNPFEGVEAMFIYYDQEGALKSYVSSGLEGSILP